MTTIDRTRTTAPAFANADKARRYDSSRYQGATGLNWYTSDPTLQFLLDFYLDPANHDAMRPALEELGALMGGPVSERAEETDRNPPRLVKYDRWGHDISEVIMPASMEASKRDILAQRESLRRAAHEAVVRMDVMNAAYSYMLNQAEIGMACALGTGGDMVKDMVDRFAPPDVRDQLMPRIESGEFEGETAQMLTERTGGSDLGQLETTATPEGDHYLLNGVKWFASNANGNIFVVLAKPEGASDDVKGVANFLVLRTRRDGSRNGVHIRQLKDKLGTKAVAEAQKDDAVRCLVLTGAGRGFCAGDDFQGIFLAEDREQARFNRRINRIKGSGVQDAVEGFFTFEKPSIAAVNGAAVGMGMDLAIMCDIRYAADNAKFGSYFVRRGVVGSTGGTYLLKYLVGLSKAYELLLTGDLVNAAEAERIGLISKVVPGDRLMDETYALARRLAGGPPLAQRAIKRVVRKGFDVDWRTLDEYSMSLSDVLWESEDHMEGVTSWVEKREPVYKGR